MEPVIFDRLLSQDTYICMLGFGVPQRCLDFPRTIHYPCVCCYNRVSMDLFGVFCNGKHSLCKASSHHVTVVVAACLLGSLDTAFRVNGVLDATSFAQPGNGPTSIGVSLITCKLHLNPVKL